MKYFDTSYIARLYLEDRGWEVVRALAATDHLACSVHGKGECAAAFHRKFREGIITQKDLGELLKQFVMDCRAGAFQWLPLSESVITRLTTVYGALPRTQLLRAADAVHLGSAAENNFPEIYSNDLRLLDAAGHFGLNGDQCYLTPKWIVRAR